MRTLNFVELFLGIFLVFSSAHFQVYCLSSNETDADYTWALTNLKDTLSQPRSTLYSPVFPLKGYPFGAQLKLTHQSNHLVYIQLAYKNPSDSGKDLDLKVTPSVRFVYRQADKIISREEVYLFAATAHYDVFKYPKVLMAARDLVNDKVSIDVSVESPLVAELGYANNGSLLWAIPDFRDKREMEEKLLVEFQTSPYFYTSPKGYRVQARLGLDGFGKYDGKGLSVAVIFLTGPYDISKDISIPHTTTVTLFNPQDPTKSLVKSVEQGANDGRVDVIDMALHEDIEKLLDKDTLYYTIQVVIN